MIGDHAKALGVEIGEREMADPAFLPEVAEMLQRVQVAIVFVIPPMELRNCSTRLKYGPTA